VCTTQGRLKPLQQPAAIGGLCMFDRSPSARPSRAMPVRHRSRLPSKAGRRHAPPLSGSRWAPMVRLLETTTAPRQMPRLGLAYSQNTHPVVQNRDVSNILDLSTALGRKTPLQGLTATESTLVCSVVLCSPKILKSKNLRPFTVGESQGSLISILLVADGAVTVSSGPCVPRPRPQSRGTGPLAVSESACPLRKPA
jgi:hypothetical protein